jgi:hypothetical protein
MEVNIIVKEEYLLRALAGTDGSISIILEAYALAPFIKTDDSSEMAWSVICSHFSIIK